MRTSTVTRAVKFPNYLIRKTKLTGAGLDEPPEPPIGPPLPPELPPSLSVKSRSLPEDPASMQLSGFGSH